jgi:putative peptidoglycan lipid II flippase
MTSLVRSGIAITVAVLLGRLLGFGRDATIAATLGINRDADIAVFLIGLPDFLINVLGAGGFTAILVVAFRQRPEIAARLMMQSAFTVLTGVGFLTLLFIAFSGYLVDTLAPGFDTATRATTISLLPLVLMSAPLATMTGPFRAFLHARERFFVAASGTMIVNATLIAGIMLAPEDATLYWLALAVLVAAMLRIAVLATASGSATVDGLRLSPWHVDVKLVIAFVRAAATEAIAFLYPLALRAVATLFGVGALASTNYATKLVQLPLGVLVMTLTTILLPRLAAAAPRADGGDRAHFLRLLDLGGYWILGMSAISVAILSTHGALLVGLAFGWGAIAADGLATISSYTAVFSLSLLPTGLNVFLRRCLNSLDETRSPFYAEAAGFVFFVVSALVVVELDGSLEAVLLTAAAGSLVSSIVLLISLNQKGFGVMGRLMQRGIIGPVVLAAIAAAAPGTLVASAFTGDVWVETGALIVGGSAGLCVLMGMNADARKVFTDLLPRNRSGE